MLAKRLEMAAGVSGLSLRCPDTSKIPTERDEKPHRAAFSEC
jgi:hypothetical protein